MIGAKDALAAGDPDRFGEILVPAHRDITANHEVSCPELDLVVDAAVDAGAYGARLTGAGWSGAAVTIVDVGNAKAVSSNSKPGTPTSSPHATPKPSLWSPPPALRSSDGTEPRYRC